MPSKNTSRDMLPNFVESPEPARAGPRASDRPYFLYAGRLEHLKGFAIS